jgi:hypothetical protein
VLAVAVECAELLDVGHVAHVLEAAPCCARPAPMSPTSPRSTTRGGERLAVAVTSLEVSGSRWR